ncbi:chitin deacetylase 7 [Patella vulgata]|uniref:chitin deacetylase 7 n=1 Tax=Patella vulgata TaxID=6465 RepID=UPI0021808E42|nr:chitin deacetylase 7 [Patella vulgata]
MNWLLLTLFVCFVVGIAVAQKKSDIENRCTPSNCKLPKCRCPGHSIPGGYKPEEIPQMVIITFDDAVNWENWGYYSRLFPPDGSRANPNGCPIGMTLFVSHNFTDYCMIKKIHARGNEIADHSVSHRLPHAWWAEATDEDLSEEILTQRQNLADLAEIPMEDLKGWRSPFLQPTGDTMFNILYKNNFTYDATMTYPFPRNVYSPVMWPFTLDYSYTLVCNIDPCPKKAYPGFWILPVVVMMDYREHLPCAYVDFCKNAPRNQDEAFQLLWKNFLRNYRTNRAPLYINLHSLWLNVDFNLDALDDFIQRLVTMDDVYITTVSKALEWVQNPVPLSQIKDFEPWKCDFKPNQEDDAFCSFTYKPRTTRPPNKPTTTTTQRPNYVNQGGGDNRNDLGIPPKGGKGNGRGSNDPRNRRPWFLKNDSPRIPTSLNTLLFVLCLAAKQLL